MTDEQQPPDDALAGAFRGVRDAWDGTNAESNLTLQRALLRTRRERRTRLTRWAALPIAAVLVASTAWAGMTGRLGPTVHGMLDTLRGVEDSSAPSATSSTALATPAPTSAPEMIPPAEPAPEPEPVVIAEPPPVAPTPTVGPAAPYVSTTLPSPLPPGEEPGERAGEAHAVRAAEVDPQAALFAEAHRLHFTDRDPARALVAWERYLAAAPNGRLAPEARYNRALALVRLGRRGEAQQELTAFASGMYGDYRRAEAKALLDAVARDASR